VKRIRFARSRALQSVPSSRKVLAIVGNTQVGLWVVRSLGRGGLKVFSVCTSASGLAAHSRYSRGAWISQQPADSPAFVEEVEALARQLGVGSIMTIAEGYHRAFIQARSCFEPDIHVFSPPADSFAKATDKDYMHALCRKLGVPVARGTTLDRFMAGRSEGRPARWPVVLRTRNQNRPDGVGAAPWKAAYAADEKQLQRLYDGVRDIAANVLVHEYHPGVEDHIQILLHDGKPFMVGEYIGEHHMPLAGGVTVQRVTCHHGRLAGDAIRLLQAVGWDGIAGVQFHYDPATGRYIFLEINPRFIGGLPTVIMAGFDAPFLLWQSHFEPHRMQRRPYELGLRTRILGGDANWMFSMIRGDQLPPGQKRLSRLGAAGRFLWNFGPWTRDDTFSLSDIKPALVDWMQMIRRLGAESIDIIGNPRTQEDTR
jgi:predicted ATP-grasp superfamily ATP-dependent carboligase